MPKPLEPPEPGSVGALADTYAFLGEVTWAVRTDATRAVQWYAHAIRTAESRRHRLHKLTRAAQLGLEQIHPDRQPESVQDWAGEALSLARSLRARRQERIVLEALALDAVRRGNHAEATDHIHRLRDLGVKASDTSPRMHYVLAWQATDDGDVAAAIEGFSAACELDIQWVANASRVLLASLSLDGDYETVRRGLRKVLDTTSDKSSVHHLAHRIGVTAAARAGRNDDVLDHANALVSEGQHLTGWVGRCFQQDAAAAAHSFALASLVFGLSEFRAVRADLDAQPLTGGGDITADELHAVYRDLVIDREGALPADERRGLPTAERISENFAEILVTLFSRPGEPAPVLDLARFQMQALSESLWTAERLDDAAGVRLAMVRATENQIAPDAWVQEAGWLATIYKQSGDLAAAEEWFSRAIDAAFASGSSVQPKTFAGLLGRCGNYWTDARHDPDRGGQFQMAGIAALMREPFDPREPATDQSVKVDVQAVQETELGLLSLLLANKATSCIKDKRDPRPSIRMSWAAARRLVREAPQAASTNGELKMAVERVTMYAPQVGLTLEGVDEVVGAIGSG